MKKIILIMLLISCQEEEIIKRNPFMTISNSIPVQFWINGVETFNEKTICGVEPVCFCQPFNSTDEIRIQFQNTSSDYVLRVLDINGNQLHEIDFIEVSSGVFQLTLIPQNYGINNQKIQFKILTKGFDNGDFNSTLTPWENFGSGDTWIWSSGKASVTNTGADSKTIRQTLGLIEGTYTISFDYTLTGAGATTIRRHIIGVDGNPTQILVIVPPSAAGSGTYSGIYTVTSGLGEFYTIGFSMSGSAGMTLEIDNIVISQIELAQSDCIDIKESHDCTTLLEYTNSKDFDGIVYETSPTSEFSLRIPAQFWKEDNPMEQEDSELSNGVIKTRRQSIQEKTLLEIGYLPNYMHKKIQKVLMHDTVTIEGNQWKRRDAYEAENINKYPLKRANVWLTLYNSIEDNIL